jgi:ABC-type sugar transport system permease subunit
MTTTRIHQTTILRIGANGFYPFSDDSSFAFENEIPQLADFRQYNPFSRAVKAFLKTLSVYALAALLGALLFFAFAAAVNEPVRAYAFLIIIYTIVALVYSLAVAGRGAKASSL